MSKQAHTCNTCTLWVQGSSILIKDDGAGTDTENKTETAKTVSHFWGGGGGNN